MVCHNNFILIRALTKIQTTTLAISRRWR